jgi:hypothetical protein
MKARDECLLHIAECGPFDLRICFGHSMVTLAELADRGRALRASKNISSRRASARTCKSWLLEKARIKQLVVMHARASLVPWMARSDPA